MQSSVNDPAESRPAPLLPAVLLSPASFLWLWVLPLAVLALLNWQGYWLVGSEMTVEQRGRALTVGVAGMTDLLLGCVTFAAAKFGRGRLTDMSHPLWGLPGLLIQIGYLWLAIATLNAGLLPRNVGAWIYSEGRFAFNQFAFCMLPAFHGLLRLAAARTPRHLGRDIAVSAALAVVTPVLLYLGLESFAHYGPRSEFDWAPYFFATLVIVAGVLMFVGVLRALLVVLRQVQSWHVTGERWAVVLLALALPFAGLLLNRTIPFPVDFQATEVYVLTTANAVVLLFAVWTGGAYPRVSWHLLWATLPFSLYFFIVFLPYTPLSVLAVIAVGLGLLVLTPILLFAMHLYLLGQAWRRVAGLGERRRLLLGGALAVLLLPAFFTGRNLADRAALNAALAHMHEPVVPAGDIVFGSSLGNLRRAVNSHRSYREGLYYPLLSDYYAWLVFDNLVLPEAKLAEIEAVFFGTPSADDAVDPFRKDRSDRVRGRAANQRRVRRALPTPQTVAVDRLETRVATAGAQSSLVTMSVALRNTGVAAAEYVTRLALPAGVFVRGFRLQVGESLVPGRIFERKTALWVYTMIRDSERRDPGIIHYVGPNDVELRVFPILSEKPIAVEIDLLVPAALTSAELADAAPTPAAVVERIGRALRPVAGSTAGGALSVAGLERLPLPVVTREPYLHLIVDRSRDNGFTGDLAAAWPALRARFPEARQVRVTVANFEVISLLSDLSTIGQREIGAAKLDNVMPLAGGLALDLALAHGLRQHRDLDLDPAAQNGGTPPRPVFVILSRHAIARTLETPLTEAWADLVPGLELFELGGDGTFVTHRTQGGAPAPLLRAGNSIRPLNARRPVRFAAGRQAVVEFWDLVAERWATVDSVRSSTDPQWCRAVELQGTQQDLDRSPGDAPMNRRALIEASRETGVLLASASYIVVENRAQWRMLERSERQKLGQNQALEFVETPAPPEVWIIAGFAGWLMGRRWWRRKQVARANALRQRTPALQF